VLVAIDESGSFVHSPKNGSWCIVAAYAFSERQKTANLQALHRLKRGYGKAKKQEVKLKEIEESRYFHFLQELRTAGGTLFAVATDGAHAEPSAIAAHRTEQAMKIRANVPRMIYCEGKQAVAALADEIDSLSPQLYLQLVCQVVLITDVIKRAVLYFVQRDPVTLRRFVWRIDQKNVPKSLFERSFQKVTPGLMQSESFRSPMIFLEGADYSHFRGYETPADQYPAYLLELGHEPQSAVNIGKILREDMNFPDSKDDETVQIADLVSAGVRRLLRGEFADGRTAGRLLGQLAIAREEPKPPISLVHLGASEDRIPDKTAVEAVLRMKHHARPMLRSA